jgi:hypothetical protein
MFWEHHVPGLFFAGISYLMWVLFLVLLIGALIRWLVGRNKVWVPHMPGMPWSPPGFYQGHQPPQQSSALQILQQRYARSEIDGATFDQMRERLEASERHDQ